MDVGARRGFVTALDPADREALTAIGRPKTFKRGAWLAIGGDASTSVYVLLAGWVKVVSSTPEGDELVLALRGPGDVVGDLAAIDDGHPARSAGIVPAEDVSALVVSAADFLDYLERHPKAMLALLRMLATRLRHADRWRVEFGSYDTLRRLAHLLVELAETGGREHADGVELGVPLAQEALASMIGASRESVARALTTLRGKHLVATSRRSIVILDLDALRAFGG